MYFYFLIIVFLYVEGSNARVVPLDFQVDKSKHEDSHFLRNEAIDNSPLHEVEILGHSIPHVEQSNEVELSSSEENDTIVSKISSRNASDDLTAKEKDVKPESSEISDVTNEEFKSVSEFRSKNLDSKEFYEILQNNKSLNDNTTKDLTFKNETAITNNLLRGLEQENNMNVMKTEEEVLNNTSIQSENFVDSDVSNGYQNETFAVFELVNDTNGDDNFPVLQPFSNDTEIESILQSEATNITDELKYLVSENLEPINDSEIISGGILSGFDFLINSEVARNAAKAMEVFNFSDPLTDHIMEENEFHSFLPVFNAGQDLDSSNLSNLETSGIITNSTRNSNETRSDIPMSLLPGDEDSITIDGAELKGIQKKSSVPFNGNELLEGKNKTGITDLAEKFIGNASSEVNSSLKIIKASDTMPTKQMINDSVSVSSTVGSPDCPSAGWCIFWFFSQDTCAINEHCHGSRICCKIGCSKTCIEIESL